MKMYLDGDWRVGNRIPIDELTKMSVHEFDSDRLTPCRREIINLQLRDYCYRLKSEHVPKITNVQKIISKHGHILRNFDLDYNVPGIENIPKDGCIILLNHSNSHDAFVVAEILERNGIPSTFLAATEGLNPIQMQLFKKANATMINRSNKESCSRGFLDFVGKVAHGDTGIIFGECTWNLHPYNAMLPIKIGAVRASAITGKRIILGDLYYEEAPRFVRSEAELYEWCGLKLSEPIKISPSEKLGEQNKIIQSRMEEMVGSRNKKAERNRLEPELYINHTWLKKFGNEAIKYDTKQEMRLIRGADGKPPENEYFWNDNHTALVPGEIPEDYFVKKKTLFGGVHIIGVNEHRRAA